MTLATLPLLFGVPGASRLFDVIFFVVVVFALVQGWTMPLVARRLRVDAPSAPLPPLTLEISSLRHVDGDIVDYTVDQDSRAGSRRVRELALPKGVVIAMIARGQQIFPPHGNTPIEVGDHVIVVLRPDARPMLNNIFARGSKEREELPPQLEFPLRATVKVGELEAFYGIRMEAPSEKTLKDTQRLPARAARRRKRSSGGVRYVRSDCTMRPGVNRTWDHRPRRHGHSAASEGRWRR